MESLAASIGIANVGYLQQVGPVRTLHVTLLAKETQWRCLPGEQPTWCFVSRRRMARVFFGRKSRGAYFCECRRDKLKISGLCT